MLVPTWCAVNALSVRGREAGGLRVRANRTRVGVRRRHGDGTERRRGGEVRPDEGRRVADGGRCRREEGVAGGMHPGWKPDLQGRRPREHGGNEMEAVEELSKTRKGAVNRARERERTRGRAEARSVGEERRRRRELGRRVRRPGQWSGMGQSLRRTGSRKAGVEGGGGYLRELAGEMTNSDGHT